MRRLVGVVVGAGMLAVVVAACSDDSSTLETLPPIKKTTTTTTTTSPPTTRPETYEIKPGESLQSVADRFGVPIDELAALNGIANVDYVQAGQVIDLPAVAQTTSSAPPGP